jgi:hypothetical protein
VSKNGKKTKKHVKNVKNMSKYVKTCFFFSEEAFRLSLNSNMLLCYCSLGENSYETKY